MKSEHTIIDDMDVCFYDYGVGPIVLLLHGWGSTSPTFDNLTALLGEKRFIALDLPGFGGSEMPPSSWDVSQYVKFVRHFLNKIGVTQPDLIIGHSFGGRIAIKGIASGDFNPRRLVLIASAGVAVRNKARQKVFSIVAKTGKFIVSIPPFSLFKQSLVKQLYKLTGSTDYLNAGPMKETFLKIIREDLKKDAKKIKVPTLLIWGENDTTTPLVEAYTLGKLINNSQLSIILKVGHFVHQEAPDEVAQRIVTFLAP